jgi:hypothetical protein
MVRLHSWVVAWQNQHQTILSNFVPPQDATKHIFAILITQQVDLSVMAGAVEESVVGQYYDPSKNQLPYGGATDLHGRVVWAVTKEEHDKMLARINHLFPE